MQDQRQSALVGEYHRQARQFFERDNRQQLAVQGELHADAESQRLVNFPRRRIVGFRLCQLAQQRQVNEQDAQRGVLAEQRWTVGITELRDAAAWRRFPPQCAAKLRRSSRAYQPGKGLRVICTGGVGFIGINVHFEAHVR